MAPWITGMPKLVGGMLLIGAAWLLMRRPEEKPVDPEDEWDDPEEVGE